MKKILIIFLVFVIHLSNAQNLKFIDNSTGEPIENIAVYSNDKNISAISNSDGIVKLDEFKSQDTINFQHPSYSLINYTKEDLENIGFILKIQKRTILLDEFTISATREKEKMTNIPFVVEIIKNKDIKVSTSQTSADILTETGNITVQKSQGGGGSPVIRGFEANKILLVVDGIRMNNAIYRSGHLQNSITIDHAILDRTEVIFGPSSVMYGSDALGGVIHYITKNPEPSFNDTLKVNTNAYTQYSTANKGIKGHFDINFGGKKMAALSSVTYSKFNDLQMGKKRSFSSETDYGLVNHYSVRMNNRDSMMINYDPTLQKNTGYTQYDLLQKFLYTPSQNIDLIANIQYSTSNNIDRFDALTDYKNDQLKFAEYYYGPQKRFLSSLKSIYKKENALFTKLTTTLAYQKIEESRINRFFNVDSSLHQIEKIDVYTANFDFFKKLNPQNKLNYGIEINFNKVNSDAFYKYIITGSETHAQTRYPNGNNNTQNVAFYFSFNKHLSRKLILTEGIRFSYAHLKSYFNDTSFINLPFNKIEINNGALTNSTSLVYHPSEEWQFNFIFSTGFRTPNIDDYGKIRAKKNFISIPNDQISPEYAYNIEFGITKSLWDAIKINGTIYHTWLKNAIVRSDFFLNGSDSIIYDREYYTMFTNSNANNAIIKGASFSVSGSFSLPQEQFLNFKNTLNIISGKYKDEYNESKALGHIPPLFGLTKVEYQGKKISFEISTIYNGKKDIEDFSPYGEDNEDEAQSNGYPAWYTINSKFTYKFNTHFLTYLAINNIMDEHYKTFASAISAPGRNFIVTLSASL